MKTHPLLLQQHSSMEECLGDFSKKKEKSDYKWWKMPSFTLKESDQKLLDTISEKSCLMWLVSQPAGCLRQYSNLIPFWYKCLRSTWPFPIPSLKWSSTRSKGLNSYRNSSLTTAGLMLSSVISRYLRKPEIYGSWRNRKYFRVKIIFFSFFKYIGLRLFWMRSTAEDLNTV